MIHAYFIAGTSPHVPQARHSTLCRTHVSRDKIAGPGVPVTCPACEEELRKLVASLKQARRHGHPNEDLERFIGKLESLLQRSVFNGGHQP